MSEVKQYLHNTFSFKPNQNSFLYKKRFLLIPQKCSGTATYSSKITIVQVKRPIYFQE